MSSGVGASGEEQRKPLGQVRLFRDVLAEEWAGCEAARQAAADARLTRLPTPSSYVGSRGTLWQTGKLATRRYGTRGGRELVQLTRFLVGTQGAPGIAQGGLIGTAFDESLAGLTSNFFKVTEGETRPILTVRLLVKYKAPVSLRCTHRIESRIDSISKTKSGRSRLAVSSRMTNTETGKVTAEAEADFVTAAEGAVARQQRPPDPPMDGPDAGLLCDEVGMCWRPGGAPPDLAASREEWVRGDAVYLRLRAEARARGLTPFVRPPALLPARPELGGVRALDNRILHEWFAGDGEVLGAAQYLPSCEGPPDHAHGGAVVTLLDHALGHTSNLPILRNRTVPGGTANLEVRFLAPVPLGETVVVRTSTDKVLAKPEPRLGSGALKCKCFLKAELTSASGKPLASGTALYIASGMPTGSVPVTLEAAA